MGREIVYCEGCGERILEEEFVKGRAVTILDKNYCGTCKGAAVRNLSLGDAFEDEAVKPSAPVRKVKSPLPVRMVRKSSGVAATIPREKARPVVRPVPKFSTRKVAVAGAAAVVGILFLVLMLPRGESPSLEAPAGESPKGSTVSAADRAYREVRKIIEESPDQTEKILVRIEAALGPCRGTAHGQTLLDLQQKYQKELQTKKTLAELEPLLTDVKTIAATDSAFTRGEEFAAKAQKARDLIMRHSPGRVAELKKAENDYGRRREEAAQEPFERIYGLAEQLRKEGRIEDAVATLQQFPPELRDTNRWLTLENILRQIEADKKPKGKSP